MLLRPVEKEHFVYESCSWCRPRGESQNRRQPGLETLQRLVTGLFSIGRTIVRVSSTLCRVHRSLTSQLPQHHEDRRECSQAKCRELPQTILHSLVRFVSLVSIL